VNAVIVLTDVFPLRSSDLSQQAVDELLQKQLDAFKVTDPLRYLAGCCKKQLNQALSVPYLKHVFYSVVAVW